MSCYNCATSFTLFNREKGCKNCGFGFCSRCLNSKAVVPATNKEEHVCKACFKILTGVVKEQRPRTPPSALERRLQQLDAPPPPKPIVVYKQGSQKMSRLKKGLSAEDQQIVDRLEQLKRERKASEQLPTDSEMRDRLSKLKGVPPLRQQQQQQQDAGSFYVKPDARPQAARADDLMNQMGEEVRMEAGAKQEEADLTDQIAQRLAKLKGVGGGGGSSEAAASRVKKLEKQSEVKDEDDGEELPSEDEAEKLVKQVMEEQKLEESRRKTDDDQDMEEDEEPPPIDNKLAGLVRQLTRDLHDKEEELPWCTICNEDAIVRCKDCDGDLYCQRCFVEMHTEFDVKHAAEKYRPPKEKASAAAY